MKVLLNNRLLDATLSCVSPDTSYPIDNLKHQFLKKVWRSTAQTDEVTVSWSADQLIDCLFVELTNATAAQLRLYDSTWTLLKTVNMAASEVSTYFAAVSGVRHAKVAFTGLASGTLYVGKIGLGIAYTLPNPKNDWIPAYKDNSEKTYSTGGQVFTNHRKPLKKMSFNFFTRVYALYTEIATLFNDLERPVFFDFTDKKHAFQRSYYADVSSNFDNPSRDDRYFTFTLTFTEAR